jgi:hypothetical protein
MSELSVGIGSTAQQIQQRQSLNKQQPLPSANLTKPKDADGDTDGDTSATETEGLDIKG